MAFIFLTLNLLHFFDNDILWNQFYEEILHRNPFFHTNMLIQNCVQRYLIQIQLLKKHQTFSKQIFIQMFFNQWYLHNEYMPHHFKHFLDLQYPINYFKLILLFNFCRFRFFNHFTIFQKMTFLELYIFFLYCLIKI